jgi:putative acetyltransferase
MIRKINGEEVNKIMKIWLDTTVEAHYFIEKEYWLEHYDSVKNSYLPNSETFVYIEENHIVGFISVVNKNYIGGLFIDIEFQGRGFGRELIEYVQEKYCDLSLAVYIDNEKAVQFYKNSGFRIMNEQRNEETSKVEYIMKWVRGQINEKNIDVYI